jgi:23S rRNA (cytosine1962-C5)-methyltransferase
LKKGREISSLSRHPWVFSGAISGIEGSLQDGDEVSVNSSDGKFIAWGLYNSKSQISVRLYSWEKEIEINDDFFSEKINDAVFLRKNILDLYRDDSASRLIYSEGDGLSGLVADKYGRYLVIQITSLAIARRIGIIVKILIESCKPDGIYLRTDKGVLESEGLILEDELIWGSQSDGNIMINENSIKFEVNPSTGQKTGFYIDQRDNRFALRKYVTGKNILDMCCYSGGFSLNSLYAGASEVTGVDVSESACTLFENNMKINNMKNFSIHKSDAFKFLEKSSSESNKYDVIILDPPKFSHSKSALKSALRGYLELNRLAFNCLTDNGILITCSCSGRVSRDDFMSVLYKSALETKRSFQVIESRGQSADHPVSIYCPESAYLKCIIGRVM